MAGIGSDRDWFVEILPNIGMRISGIGWRIPEKHILYLNVRDKAAPLRINAKPGQPVPTRGRAITTRNGKGHRTTFEFILEPEEMLELWRGSLYFSLTDRKTKKECIKQTLVLVGEQRELRNPYPTTAIVTITRQPYAMPMPHAFAHPVLVRNAQVDTEHMDLRIRLQPQEQALLEIRTWRLSTEHQLVIEEVLPTNAVGLPRGEPTVFLNGQLGTGYADIHPRAKGTGIENDVNHHFAHVLVQPDNPERVTDVRLRVSCPDPETNVDCLNKRMVCYGTYDPNKRGRTGPGTLILTVTDFVRASARQTLSRSVMRVATPPSTHSGVQEMADKKQDNRAHPNEPAAASEPPGKKGPMDPVETLRRPEPTLQAMAAGSVNEEEEDGTVGTFGGVDHSFTGTDYDAGDLNVDPNAATDVGTVVDEKQGAALQAEMGAAPIIDDGEGAFADMEPMPGPNDVPPDGLYGSAAEDGVGALADQPWDGKERRGSPSTPMSGGRRKTDPFDDGSAFGFGEKDIPPAEQGGGTSPPPGPGFQDPAKTSLSLEPTVLSGTDEAIGDNGAPDEMVPAPGSEPIVNTSTADVLDELSETATSTERPNLNADSDEDLDSDEAAALSTFDIPPTGEDDDDMSFEESDALMASLAEGDDGLDEDDVAILKGSLGDLQDQLGRLTDTNDQLEAEANGPAANWEEGSQEAPASAFENPNFSGRMTAPNLNPTEDSPPSSRPPEEPMQATESMVLGPADSSDSISEALEDAAQEAPAAYAADERETTQVTDMASVMAQATEDDSAPFDDDELVSEEELDELAAGNPKNVMLSTSTGVERQPASQPDGAPPAPPPEVSAPPPPPDTDATGVIQTPPLPPEPAPRSDVGAALFDEAEPYPDQRETTNERIPTGDAANAMEDEPSEVKLELDVPKHAATAPPLEDQTRDVTTQHEGVPFQLQAAMRDGDVNTPPAPREPTPTPQPRLQVMSGDEMTAPQPSVPMQAQETEDVPGRGERRRPKRSPRRPEPNFFQKHGMKAGITAASLASLIVLVLLVWPDSDPEEGKPVGVTPKVAQLSGTDSTETSTLSPEDRAREERKANKVKAFAPIPTPAAKPKVVDAGAPDDGVDDPPNLLGEVELGEDEIQCAFGVFDPRLEDSDPEKAVTVDPTAASALQTFTKENTLITGYSIAVCNVESEEVPDRVYFTMTADLPENGVFAKKSVMSLANARKDRVVTKMKQP